MLDSNLSGILRSWFFNNIHHREYLCDKNPLSVCATTDVWLVHNLNKKIMLTPVVCRIPVLHLFSLTLNYIGTSTADFAV